MFLFPCIRTRAQIIEQSTNQPELDTIAKYYFDGQGKALRPMVCMLMARAINYHIHKDNRYVFFRGHSCWLLFLSVRLIAGNPHLGRFAAAIQLYICLVNCGGVSGLGGFCVLLFLFCFFLCFCFNGWCLRVCRTANPWKNSVKSR